MIARQGLGQLTHRRVAAEADVPVGSTTYYFRDLDALGAAALAHSATTSAEGLAQWGRELDKNADLPATLARLTGEYLADRDRHRALNELYLAATHRVELQRLARLWPDGLVALLEPRVGRRAAEAVTVYLDGATLHALITGSQPSVDAMTDAIAKLIN